MQGLIRFFIRYSQFFLFLILEVIALILVVSFNSKQRDLFQGKAVTLVANVHRTQRIFTDYYGLREKVNQLSRENAALRRTLYEQKLKIRKLERQPDAPKIETARFDSSYTFLPARVLSNSQNLRNNHLLLDQGSDAGVEVGMGVIGPEGVVGIVTHVSPLFSQVMSVLHSQFRLSAGLAGKNYFGTLLWPGQNPQKFRLKDIPIHANIEEGDVVETSGYSYVFPEGIPIGTIDRLREPPGEYFYELTVKASYDLADMHLVYVVNHPLQDELESVVTNLDP